MDKHELQKKMAIKYFFAYIQQSTSFVPFLLVAKCVR